MLPTGANPDDGSVDAARVLEAARRAEAAGFDGVYVGDHILHPRPLLESVVTLSAVAASTQRVSFGPCVMLIALRQVVVLAKQLATLTTFAPGRLRVGIGVGGEYPAEFDAAGVRLSDRGLQTAAAAQHLRALLAGQPIDGADTHRTDVTIAPAAHGEVPFLFAGWRDPALRRAARLGDGWIGYLLAPESFARRRSFVMDRRAELGLPTEAFTTGMLLPVYPDPETNGARARAAAGWSKLTMTGASFPERLFVAGPPDELVAQLRRYWEVGCDEMVLALVDHGAGYLDQLDVIAAEVLPDVRAFA